MADRKPRSAGAWATRRWRRQRAEGLIVVPVEVWNEEIVALVRQGLLRCDEMHDRVALEVAIGALLDEALPQTPTAARTRAPRWAREPA